MSSIKPKTVRKPKIAIFIDGSNLYFKIKKTMGPKYKSLEFDFQKFCQQISKKGQVVYAGYYVGVIRAKAADQKAQKLRTNQQKLFSHLRESNINVVLGQLIQNDGVFHEKGVDVRIGIDMVTMAYEKKYDLAILVSSDTDLIPAIKKIKELKKTVHYIGFSAGPSLGLQKHCDYTKIFDEDSIELLKKSPKIKIKINRND